MSITAATYSLADTAKRIGRTYDWFAHNRRRLASRHGFPPPLPGPGHPRWSAAQVDAWCDGTPAAAAAADPRDAADPRTAELMDHRARALAGTGD